MRALFVVAVLAWTAPAFAQPPGAAPPPHPLGPPGQRGPQTAADKVKQRVREVRDLQLTQQLSLDEQSAGRIFAVMGRYDEEFDRLLAVRAELQRKLAAADQLKDPRAIDILIDDAIANQKAFRDLEGRRLSELRKILTPQQTARLLVVLPALERKLQNQLQRAIAGAAKNRRPNRPRPPGDDDDDD